MSSLDPRRWFDRMAPQTLQIATWLLYLNGFFALIDIVDGSGYLRYVREEFPGGILIGIAIVAACIGSGWLMANDRKRGYQLAIVAAFAPFIVRYLAYSHLANKTGATVSFYDKISGGNTISLVFEVALCALILHPQSREHQKVWYK